MFKERDKAFLEKINEYLQLEIFVAGQDIITEGDISDRMYFLHRGQVEMLMDKQHVTHLHSGSAFGESGLVGTKKRTAVATVRAVEFCDCRTIQFSHFQSILKLFPNEKAYFEKRHQDQFRGSRAVRRPSQHGWLSVLFQKGDQDEKASAESFEEGNVDSEIIKSRRRSISKPRWTRERSKSLVGSKIWDIARAKMDLACNEEKGKSPRKKEDSPERRHTIGFYPGAIEEHPKLKGGNSFDAKDVADENNNAFDAKQWVLAKFKRMAISESDEESSSSSSRPQSPVAAITDIEEPGLPKKATLPLVKPLLLPIRPKNITPYRHRMPTHSTGHQEERPLEVTEGIRQSTAVSSSCCIADTVLDDASKEADAASRGQSASLTLDTLSFEKNEEHGRMPESCISKPPNPRSPLQLPSIDNHRSKTLSPCVSRRTSLWSMTPRRTVSLQSTDSCESLAERMKSANAQLRIENNRLREQLCGA